MEGQLFSVKRLTQPLRILNSIVSEVSKTRVQIMAPAGLVPQASLILTVPTHPVAVPGTQ